MKPTYIDVLVIPMDPEVEPYQISFFVLASRLKVNYCNFYSFGIEIKDVEYDYVINYDISKIKPNLFQIIKYEINI